MSLGFHEQRRRRQSLRRAWQRIIGWSFVLSLALAICYIAYDQGTALARRDVVRLEEKLAGVEVENADLTSKLDAALEIDKALELEYGSSVSPEQAKRLVNLVRERLAAGITADRLAFVVGAARNEEHCDDNPSTKRFIVQTDLSEGANDTVSFADNTIVVTASGTPALNPDGKPESWFDASQSIKIKFAVAGGDMSETEGVLPLHPSVVVGNSEYRFNLVAGARGFINTTGRRCDFP